MKKSHVLRLESGVTSKAVDKICNTTISRGTISETIFGVGTDKPRAIQ